MIRKLFVLAVLSANALFAQRYERLIETRSISNHEIVGAEHDASSNSLFILSNVSNQNGNGLLAKINALNGDTIWSKFVAPTVQQENFKGLYKSTNALFAYGLRTFQSAQYAFIAKLNFNGDTIWTKHYKTLATTSCTNPHITINGLLELSNGDLVMVGRNNACDRAVLLKTNSLGVVSLVKEYDQWLQNVYSPLWEFYGIQTDGINFFVSARYGKAQQNWDYYKGIWKLDLNGDLVSSYNSQFAQNSEIFGFKRDAAGNFYLLGQHNPITQSVGILEKFNASGVSQWTYNPSGVTIQWSGITDIEFDANGDALVSGFFQKQNQSVDQFASRINSSNGAEIWNKQYGYGDNGYGRELVNLGTNFLMVSDESFGWDARDNYGVSENSPSGTTHAVIQVFNSNGQVGKFKKSPWQDSKRSKTVFFAYAAFSFNSGLWTNVNLVPVTLASATGGSSGFNAWNNNNNFEIWMSSQNQNGNGQGTFYFTASDKNGDLRSSDTLEVIQPSSFSGEDVYGNTSAAACSGDSLKLVPSVLHTGSTYKWLYFGVNGTSAATRVGTGLNFYAKQKGYYALREVLFNQDSAQTNTVLLTIETDRVAIISSAYPQTFWVSGTASDSTTKSNPSLTNWSTNKHLHQWIAPFGRYRQSNVQQYFYSVSDLIGRGLSAGSKISEIAFELAQSYSGGSLEDFKIAFRWTTQSTNTWITFNSSDVVYDNYWQNPSSSSGSLSFNINDQTWNGTSALMIQVSYRVSAYNASTDLNPVFKLEESSVNTTRVLFAQNNSLTLIGNTGTGGTIKTFKYRPLTKFKIGYPAKQDTIVSCGSSITLSVQNTGYQDLTWNNGATTSTRQITSPSLAYVTMVDGNFCVSQDTVRVLFNPNTNQIVSSGLKVHPGGTITLSALPRSINLWSNGASGNTTTVTNSGKYKLTSINSDGCSYVDSVTVEVLKTPTIYKGDRGAYRGTPVSGFTYMGKIGTSHVYYSNSCKSWNNAVQNVSQLGAKFWYPKSASDNAAIKALYNSKISYSGGRWIGIYRPSSTSTWRDLSGSPVTYTNWDVNYNQNGLYGFIEFSWSGFWNASTDASNDCREFFISFEDESSIASANETVCDSIKLWTPEGFDSYQWTIGTSTLTTTTNELWAKNTGVHSVKGVYSGTAYNGSNSVSLTVNASPAISILNKSGTVDLTGSNSVKLKAIYPSGSSIQWFVNGVAQSLGQDSVVSNTVGWHRLVVTLNGCSSIDSVRLSQPIFVAKTGNDQTGNGTLGLPYLTIQKGVDMATNGGKVYVLPGNYVESVNITKPIVLASNYLRLGDVGAVDLTKITSSNGAYSVRVSGNFASDTATSKIVGFTLTGKTVTGNEEGAFTIKNVNGAPSGTYLLKQNKITGNSIPCCNDWSGSAIQSTGHNAHLIVQGGEISANNIAQQDHRGVIATNRNLTFDGVRIVNNFASQGIFKISETPRVDFVNCLIAGNVVNWNGHSLFTVPGWGGTEPKLNFIHSTIADNETGEGKLFLRDGLADVRFLNSIWKNTTVLQNGVFQSTGKVSGVGSILPDINVLPAIKYATYHNTNANIYGIYSGLNANYSLGNSSSAIGLGANSASLGGVLLVSTNKDLNGLTRPNPVGSNSDAGAFESPLAIGDFSASIASCGYELKAVVANSNNYLVEWVGPNGYAAFIPTIQVTQLGTYTLKVFSLDRSDTIITTFNLTSPLSFEVLTVKDVCSSVSSTSGRFTFGRVSGGTPLAGSMSTHRFRVKNSTGQQIDGWDFMATNSWSYTKTDAALGNYVIEVEDGVGCIVRDTISLSSKTRRTMFVSSSGSNSNAGTQSAPYATIQHAINQSCDRDTIILENGIYFQDSIVLTADVIVGSRFVLNGDTNHINNTIVDGALSEAVMFVNVPTDNWNQPLLDTTYKKLIGFTIQRGYRQGGIGGGVNVSRGNIVLRDMVLKNNEGANGGAVHVVQDAGTVLIDRCRFIGNKAVSGSAFYARGGYFVIRKSEFVQNVASGDATVYFDNWCCGQGGYVVDSKFLYNTANSNSVGSWQNWRDGFTATTSKNIVAIGNKSLNGSLFSVFGEGSGSEIVLENWILVKNIWGNSSRMFEFTNQTVQVKNATISNNIGGQLFGIGYESKLYVTNSILSHSNSVLLVNDPMPTSTAKSWFSNCAMLQPTLTNGTHVFSNLKSLTGVYFSDPSADNFENSNMSSVLGQGLSSIVLGNKTILVPTKDYKDRTRPLPANSNPDLGAHESFFGTPQVGIVTTQVNPSLCDTSGGSASATLVNAVGVYSASWVKVGSTYTASGSTALGLSNGDYVVTFTPSTSGVSFSDTVKIRIPSALSLATVFDSANCSNDLVPVQFLVSGGTPSLSTSYTTKVTLQTAYGKVKTFEIVRTGKSFTANLPSGIYTVEVTDGKNCKKVFSLLVPFKRLSPSIVFSSNVRIKGVNTDTVTIAAVSTPSSVLSTWINPVSSSSSIVTNTKGWKVALASNFGCVTRDSINYQWYCDTARFSGMGTLHLRDSIGVKIDSTLSSSFIPPNYGVPILKVTTPGSYIITSSSTYNFPGQGNGKYIVSIKPSPVLTIVNLSNKIDIDSTAIKLYASRPPFASLNWYRGSLLLGTSDTISVNTQGVVRAVVAKNGCSRRDSLMIFKPLYVAANGSNSNPGTLNQPFKTIQHGINQSVAGGKVYVLPGVYQERLEINKNVQLLSDFVRLNDQGAIASTIVDAQHLGRLIKVEGFTPIAGQIRIEGFTFRKGFGDNSSSGAGIYVNTNSSSSMSQAYVEISNSKFTDIYRVCCSDGIALFTGWNGTQRIRFKGVEFSQIGGLQNGDQRRAFAINSNSFVEFIDSKISQVYSDNGVFSINGGKLMLYNSHVSNSNTRTNSDGIFRIEGSNPKLELLHTTVNNVMFDNQGTDRFIVYNAGGNNATVSIRNSVLSQVNDRIFKDGSPSSVYTIEGSVVSSTNTLSYSLPASSVSAPAQTLPNGVLLPNSPAIGRGVSQWYSLYPRLSFSQDLLKQPRPLPLGSNPDAGAFESVLAQGNFDVSIINCGYELASKVLNTNNYLIEWNGPNNFLAFTSKIIAPTKGSYTLKVFSLDRNDTIVKSFNLTNPLDFDILTVKDVCTAVSSTSGAFSFGNVTGGVPFSSSWWTNQFQVYNAAGMSIDGWQFNQGTNWTYTRQNAAAGIYIVKVEDASGCIVSDTVEVKSRVGRNYYVSTAGSNANNGTAVAPFKSLKYAISQSCDRDTIVVLPGTHVEDSIVINKPIYVTSKQYLTGDSSFVSSTVIRGINNAVFYYSNVGNALITDTLYSGINGLTIEGGRTTSGERGGGFDIRESTLKISNCAVQGNTGHFGGGITLQSWNTRVVIANTVVRDNIATSQAGGVNVREIRSLTLRNVRVLNNQSNGDNGGIWLRYIQNLTIDGLVVKNNYSVGSYPVGEWRINGWGTYRNMYIADNVGGSGSNHSMRVNKEGWNDPTNGQEITFVNFLLVRNVTQNWPSLFLDGNTQLRLINSVVSDNSGRSSGYQNEGNIAFNDNAHLRLFNSIVTKNGAYAIVGNGCGTSFVTAKNSLIEGGQAAISNPSCGSQGAITTNLISPNLTTAPFFVDRTNGDYRLAKFSSLIGYGIGSAVVGTGTTLTAPVMDITGAARPQPVNTNPDVGVYEHPAGQGMPGLNLIVTNNGSCQTANGAATVNLIRINNQPTGTPAISWIKLNDPTWTPQTTNTISGLSSGSYQVTVTVGTSAPFIDTAVVTTAAPITLVNNSLLTNCFGGNDGTLKFSIQGGSPFTGGTYKYNIVQLVRDGGVANYSDNSTQERSATFMASQRSSGTYRVSITDAKGCQFVDTITLGYRNALPTAQITASGPLTICEGEAVSLDATTTNATNVYSWNDGSNLSINTVGTSGSWVVTVTDTAGCSNSDKVVVDVKATPVIYTGTPPAYNGNAISGDYDYLGTHNGNHYYIYKYHGNVNWTQAKLISEQLGGHLWVVDNAQEQSAVTSMIQQFPQWHGEALIGANFVNGQWTWVNGAPFSYTNWATNQANNGSSTKIRVQFNWGGQWERFGGDWTTHKFIVEFPNGARNLATPEAFCDSVTVSAPEGFDSYVWKNTANNNAVVGTSRSLTVTSSMAVKVEGTLNKSNNTTCTLESQTHTITINQTPTASIVNHSGTTDLYGNDTVILGANVATGATWSWSNPGSTTSLGSNDTLLVTIPNYYVLSAINASCERRDSVRVDEPLFVSVSGSNATGNGSFAAPYRTIQKGVNQAPSGGKVYVLPGNYVESVVVTKPVKIYSDFERLGSTTAIGQTKITSQNGNFSIAIRMDSSGAVQNFTKQNMHISGFTIQGKNASNDMGAIDICPAPSFDWNNVNKQKGKVLISNIDFTNNTTQSNNASAFASRGNEVHTYFENIKVRNSNIGVDPRGVLYFWQTKGGTFNNAQIFGNDGIVFNIDGQNMNMSFNNTAVFNNNIKGTTWGGYFNIQGSNNTLEFLNSTLSGNIMASQDARLFRTNNGSGTKVILKNSILNTSGSPVYSGQVSFEARHSLLPLTSVLALADFTYYDTTNVHSSVARVQGYELLPNSPAIGIGSVLYSSPKDIDGKNRPLPAGTNPDAGAFESNLAFGELDLAITSCGYQVTATVLNSKNYSISWSGPGGYSSAQTSPLLPLKGIYQATLIAFDRQDTIVRTLNLNNPLEFSITSVKDVCDGVSANSGRIRVSAMKGGSIYQLGWGDYYLRVYRNGSQVWQNNIYNGPTNTQDIGGLSAGVHVVRLEDAVGCFVYDTVVIGSQPSNTYFISTTGSDSALGTASNPLKTISEALTRACDGDTIILEDGRHYENVIMGNNSPRLTIASRYLLDGDTNHIHNAIVDGMDVNPVFNISNLNNRGTTDTLRLLGFTATNGLANSGWNGGGGISARWSNVSLVKIRAVENRSGQNGGGIGIWECDLKLKDVLIKDNFATNDGGGLHLQYINNDLLNTNVRIVGNQSSNGGGLYYSHGLGATGQVYELDGFEVINNFATNQGGGIYFGCWSGEADVQLSNSKVIGNRATNQAGGIVVQSNNADFFFVNDIIAKNESGYAGAMRINNSKAHFVHSTVYSNKHILGSTSSILNLAVHVENQSSLKMYNSILGGQGTGGKNVYIQDNNSNFEIVSGQLGGGVSNTVQAPNANQIIYLPSSPNYTNQQVFLKDPNGGDYSLAKVSQAIGRGLTSFTNGPSVPLVDIFGNARPNLFGSDPDFGAIESNDTAASFGVAFVVSDNNACNPSIGQITAFPQNGSGAYTYTWTALTSGGIISNPTGTGLSHTIANLFTGQYRVVVTDVANNVTFIDTAVVRGDSPLVLNKVVTNEGCQGTNSGSISIDVTGGSGFYTYTWLRPNGGVSNTKNITNLTPGIYSVTVTDNKGCSVSATDTVGTSFAQPTLNITSQIVKAGGTSVSGGSDVRMCIGDQVVFNAGSGFDYYEWNKSDGLNTEYSQTVSSYVSETYSVYVEDTNGCSTTGTAKIFVVYEPNVYASNVNRTMGQQFQQVTSYVRGDTTSESNLIGGQVSPYNAQGNSLKKSQFVISASELQGAGLTENTTINSLAFDVINPNGTAFQAYKIKLAHTTAQQLGSWQSPADQQEVFAIPVYAPVQGWNTHNFTNAFAWNGVDNLLVEVCYTPIGNAMSSASVRVNQVATTNSLTNFSYSANSCSDPVQNWQKGSSTWRPTVRFGIDKVEVLDTIRVCDFTTLNTTDDYDTYTWYVNGVASPTAALALNLTSPASVVLAATDAASSCVMYSDTFYVALDATPTVLATSNIVGAVCAGDSVVLSTPSVGLASYLWSNGDTSMTSTVFESGAYILEARSANGCAGTDTVVVNVNTPPTVVVKLNGKTLTATDGSLATKVNTCVQSVLLPFGENFEDSLYVWTQSTADQLNWTYNSGATNTQFSGPNGDFTTSDSSGNYYYLDRAGSNSDDNKEAHLISPCVQMIGSSRPYLTFGYHMYNGLYNAANPSSDNMGTLRVEVQTTDDAANYWVPLWTKTGHQGIGWKSDTVDLTQFAGQTIRLRIVGKAGVGGPRSEMAIDGISIIDTANSFANTSGRISADIICEGDLLIAQTISNGSTQFNYVWNTGDTTSALKVDSTGYYFVSVYDENGCSIQTDSVWIEVSPNPNNILTVTGDLSNCYNETVAVTVQAPMNYSKYSWFSNDSTIVPSGTTTTLVSMQGLAIGNYALGVRIFDSIGCAAISDTVVVNRYVQPMIQDSVVPVSCFGDSTGSILVTPLTGPMSWSWSNGDSASANLGLPTGLYTLVFTDEHGCSDTTSMNVIEPAPLALTFSSPSTQPVSCFGGADGSIVPIVTGGNGGYQYSWSGTQFGSTSDTLSGLNAGTYVLNVMDAKGCFISDTHVVVEPAILSATVDSTWNASCYQANDGWISVNVAGGNGGYLMNWINSLGQSVGSNDTVTNLLAGTYQFIVTDLKGCTDSIVQIVTEPQVLDLSTISSVFVGGNNIRCFGDSSGVITTTTVGGTLPYQWQWSNGSVVDNIDSLIAGTYSVVVTDLRGCQDSATVVLSEPTELLGSAVVQDVLCHDDQSGSVVVTTSGAVAPYWLDWASTGVDSGMTRVTLVLDLRSATSINSPSVGIVGTASNIPMVTYHNDSIYYLTLERQPGTALYYRFYNGASPELVPLACGINPPSLTTLHRNLIVGSNDTTLNRVCFASCVDCNGQVTGARSDVLVGSSTTVSSQGAGVITLTIVDANGCSTTFNDTIVQPDAINIQLDTIVDVSCPQAGDGSIQLTTIGGIMPYAFDWSNGATIEDLLTVNEGTYTITVTDFNGCVDTATYEIMAPMPYNFEEICMMTVDSLTGKNQVVWNKTSGQRTMEYQILKETNVAGQYAQIGTVPYLNMSVFTDVNSVPQQQPDRYKIIAVDSCGNSSDTSDLHRTIHLQSNFGSGGEVNLSWTDYEGRAVQTYDIFRWVSAGNLVQIGSVSGATTTFSDLNPPVAPNVYYNVRAVFAGGACAPAAGKTSSYESARSNILDQTGIGMPDLPWKGLARMFPNPTNSMVRIEVPESGFVVRVTNMLGQLIHETSVQESSVVLDLGHVAAGMYQVELYRDGQVMSIDKLHVVH